MDEEGEMQFESIISESVNYTQYYTGNLVPLGNAKSRIIISGSIILQVNCEWAAAVDGTRSVEGAH